MTTNTDKTPSKEIPDLISKKEDQANEHSRFKRILHAVLGSPKETDVSKAARELKEKTEEDKLEFPRTEEEERERQARIEKRRQAVRGNAMPKISDVPKKWGDASW
jgi:hypothetical protein